MGSAGFEVRHQIMCAAGGPTALRLKPRTGGGPITDVRARRRACQRRARLAGAATSIEPRKGAPVSISSSRASYRGFQVWFAGSADRERRLKARPGPAQTGDPQRRRQSAVTATADVFIRPRVSDMPGYGLIASPTL